MDDKYTDLAVKLAEVDARGTSNSDKINEHDEAIKELRNEQKALITIATSVEKIALDMSYVKEDVAEVKKGQDALNSEVATLKNKPAQETVKRITSIKDKFILGVVAVLATSFATYFIQYVLPKLGI